MTRNECMQILKNKNSKEYKELHHIFYKNRNICKKFYINAGLYEKGYVLHHKILNCDNYEEWKIDEIQPMSKKDHSYLHMVIYKQGLCSKASIQKAHETLQRKYKSGELTIWNKGKKGVQVSNRKGKTGKEFPFLRASKNKGRIPWNKGKRCPSPSKETIEKQRKTMKERTKLGKNNTFIYACKNTIFINNGYENKRISKNLLIPEGWKIGRIKKINKG